MQGPDDRCFLAAWAVGTSFRNVRQKPNLPTSKSNPSPRCSPRASVPQLGHTINKFGRPAVLQLSTEGLTVIKTNVLHHLALQYEALVILLQETHCTCADKLTISDFALAGSSLSKKYGLATFIRDRLK